MLTKVAMDTRGKMYAPFPWNRAWYISIGFPLLILLFSLLFSLLFTHLIFHSLREYTEAFSIKYFCLDFIVLKFFLYACCYYVFRLVYTQNY